MTARQWMELWSAAMRVFAERCALRLAWALDADENGRTFTGADFRREAERCARRYVQCLRRSSEAMVRMGIEVPEVHR